MPQDTLRVRGAGHSIGKGTAQIVAKLDVNLVLADTNEQWLAATASHCERNGRRSWPCHSVSVPA
jgi:short-subunit dehydrogenase